MLSIREIMTTDLFTLEASATLAGAEQLMKTHRVRHIPIIDVEKILNRWKQSNQMTLMTTMQQTRLMSFSSARR
ncbi:MAG: CBS domain-containing protein [Pseudomonadales bacterium]|nr:CBS domain-containing protein [Pseudomonadales bacterium]